MAGRGAAASLVVLALLYIGTASAQSGQKHPLTNIPPPNEDVDTQFWVPERPGLNFPAGEAIEVVVGLHNGASEGYNVSAIFGSLNHPTQFSTFFYNFSGQGYGQSMGPGEEVSLSYTLYMPPQLPPREFQVALTVFYNSPTAGYATTFFNRTVDIIEPPQFVDSQLLFLWLLLLGGLGAAGYAGWNYVQGLPMMRKANIKRAKASKFRASQQPARDANPGEWLQGTNFAKGAKQPPRRKLSQRDIQKAASAANGQS